jgi:hypothetical protein
MTPKETAERIVMDYLKKMGGGGSFLPRSGNMTAAKQLAHYTVDKMIEELRMYGQDCFKGIERRLYWIDVKKNIDKAFEDKG